MLHDNNTSELRLLLSVAGTAICTSALWTSIQPAAVAAPARHSNEGTAKPRVVITADPELDDNNTIIRAILYSSDVKSEGLIMSAASSIGEVTGRHAGRE